MEINISIKTNVINVQVHLQKKTIPSLNVRAKHANSRHKSLYVKLKLERHDMANLKLLETITKLYTILINAQHLDKQHQWQKHYSSSTWVFMGLLQL